MRLNTTLPVELNLTFRRNLMQNFKAIQFSYDNLLELIDKHKISDRHAHDSKQIDFRNTSVSTFLNYLEGNINNLVLGANGDGFSEVKHARVSLDGSNHDLLQDRLLYDYTNTHKIIDRDMNSSESLDYVWEPPKMKSNILGEDGTPKTWNPEEHLDTFFNPLVDNDYVTKKTLGKDESGQYNIYKYTFEPENYSKTLLITACIHGNENTGFFNLCQFLPILVNEWEKYPQFKYLRKNVRLIVVPIVNPWGFANRERENINNVDLNRNFDYNWQAGKGTDPTKANYKGSKPFSEKESQLMRNLVQSIDGLTAHVDLHDIISSVNDYCLFYPRWANQENNNMTRLINELSNKGDLIVWGSSTLSSFSNWVAIKMKVTSYLSETYEGRVGQKKGSAEMQRTIRWNGNIIFRMAQLNSTQKGQTADDSFIKVIVYDDRFNGKSGKKITLRSEQDKWQRILMSQQKFKTISNGFVELHGFVTLSADRDVEIGVSPNIVQNYHPFFGAGKSKDRNLFAVEHVINKGNTTIPIYAAAGVQMSTTTESSIKRTNEILPLIDVKKKDTGVVTIKQIKLFVKFTPTHSANSVQILKSGEKGNLKQDTFEQLYPNTIYDDDIRNDITH